MTARVRLGVVISTAIVLSSIAADAQDRDPLIRQPAYERAAEAGLPQPRALLWTVLRRTKIGEDASRGVFTAFSPEAKALNGHALTLSGFMLPLDAEPRSQHFLLLRYTPVCFFCPSGGHDEVVGDGGKGRSRHRSDADRDRQVRSDRKCRARPLFPGRRRGRALTGPLTP
jgi:hypothetical protein